jgi:hypothetical protein
MDLVSDHEQPVFEESSTNSIRHLGNCTRLATLPLALCGFLLYGMVQTMQPAPVYDFPFGSSPVNLLSVC